MSPVSLLAILCTAHAAEPAWPDVSVAPKAGPGYAPGDAALIVAIEDYAVAPDIPGAQLDAAAWDAWFTARGVGTLKVLRNEDATREDILEAARGVAARVAPGGRLWVVFIGHGAPSQKTDDGVLVGWDAKQTASSIDTRSVTRSELIAALAGPQKETVLVLDACFSGRTSDGAELTPGLASLKPVSERLDANVTTLTAAKSDQYAGALAGSSLPAFSYLVLGAMRGWGDADGDGSVTATEAVKYADHVMFETVTGRTQTPTVSGPALVLSSGARETAPALRAVGGGADVAPESSGRCRLEWLSGTPSCFDYEHSETDQERRVEERAFTAALATYSAAACACWPSGWMAKPLEELFMTFNAGFDASGHPVPGQYAFDHSYSYTADGPAARDEVDACLHAIVRRMVFPACPTARGTLAFHVDSWGSDRQPAPLAP